MSRPPPLPEDVIASKRRAAQQLLAYGQITGEEYDLIGRHYGFVSPPKLSLGAKALTGAAWAGYALAALAAVAELVALRHPEMKGPLETLTKLAQLAAEGL